MVKNTLSIGSHVFKVHSTTFRYITDDRQGKPGWEFNICTEGINTFSLEDFWCDNGVRFYAEGDPIPLPSLPDLVGQKIYLKEPFDEESGDPYFSVYIGEHGDVDELTMRFLERDESRYHIAIEARLPAGSLFHEDQRLTIDTWIEQLPPGKYGS
ncbi:hypothetical protein [Singulisphaera sp. PoT]|uniref:hypothetical protein n=1 Tax=Singulisphaera sp. PoT TaxID=3411797 RepID=UPI003BF4DFE1